VGLVYANEEDMYVGESPNELGFVAARSPPLLPSLNEERYPRYEEVPQPSSSTLYYQAGRQE